jgi:hypothetical protein
MNCTGKPPAKVRVSAQKAVRRVREKPAKKIGNTTENSGEQRKVIGRPWLPGQSGNPGGRPAIAAEVREFAGAHSIEALKKVVRIMRTSRDHSTVLAAARTVLDRAIGKPQQIIGGVNGASLVNITMQNGGAVITEADAEAAYRALCDDPNADISGITFAAPARPASVECPVLPPLPAPTNERQEKLKLWTELGK